MRICEIENCDGEYHAKNLCKSHYNKQWMENRLGKGAVEEGAQNVKSIISYDAAHYRVRVAKGKASDYKCVDCPEQAHEWSLNEESEHLLIQASGHQAGRKFSTNIEDYEPRCRSCHKKYDAIHGVLRESAYERSEPRLPNNSNDGECAFDGCDKHAISKRLCFSHYRQYSKGMELRPLRKYNRLSGESA